MRGYALRRVAFCVRKMPNVLIAAYASQGVALGSGQQLGLQPATIIAKNREFRAQTVERRSLQPVTIIAKNWGVLRMLELIGAGC